MQLGARWLERYGAAPSPPTSTEYHHPRHLHSPQPAYRPQPLPPTTTTNHHYPPPPLSSFSYYFPDPNPSYSPDPNPSYSPDPNPSYSPDPNPSYSPDPNPSYSPDPNPSYSPDPNPSYSLVSVIAESNTLLRYPPLDLPSPLRYSSLGSYYNGHRPSTYEFAAAGPPPSSLSAARVGSSMLSSYYYDGGRGGRGGESYSFSVKETILQYGVDPSRYDADIPRATLEPDLMVIGPKRTPHQNFRPNTYSKVIAKGGKGGKNITKSGRKITKVKRSAYCEVCKIQCDTEEVLKCHKQGKKHKANLHKLQESITAKPAAATETNSEITEAPASDKDKATAKWSKRKDVPVTAEELEAKKRRVLDGGAAVDGVKVCTVCNVVVNSPKVFEYHIQGQKHAAMVKQQQEQLNAPNAPEN